MRYGCVWYRIQSAEVVVIWARVTGYIRRIKFGGIFLGAGMGRDWEWSNMHVMRVCGGR